MTDPASADSPLLMTYTRSSVSSDASPPAHFRIPGGPSALSLREGSVSAPRGR
jgi:hypothetical protein